MVSSSTLYSLFAAALVPFVIAHDNRVSPHYNPVSSSSTYLAILVKNSTGNRVYTLSCNPAAGNHPQPQAACDYLQSVNGNLNTPPNSQTFCTLEYNPVGVTVLGLYQGKVTIFNQQYSNPCFASIALGSLYP
ncbi:subtilisin inhibitor [Blakeslea trispora]|nr:subtilisin inhibitor [Blakeslea trispora]